MDRLTTASILAIAATVGVLVLLVWAWWQDEHPKQARIEMRDE